jgi:hypothetical protein
LDSQLIQELIDALHSCTRAIEANTAARSTGGGGDSLTSAGKKPGGEVWDAVHVKSLGKEFPNKYGFYSAKIGGGGDAEWFSTKSKSIAAVLEAARENEWMVDITFDTSTKGQYVNRYIQTIQKSSDIPRPAPLADVAEEEQEEAPF